ncbi:MAG TPA: hypothetical protein VJ558_04610 [Bacillales bacterium]|nr:hypothetical protein [Bacillales bacterium]
MEDPREKQQLGQKNEKKVDGGQGKFPKQRKKGGCGCGKKKKSK